MKLSEDKGVYYFNCPGCKMLHGLDSRWKFNGDFSKPTFSPSLLVRYPWGPEQKQCVCHSFITDGFIRFLSDCTHELKDQTVEIPEWN
jgi:hypothetical protein